MTTTPPTATPRDDSRITAPSRLVVRAVVTDAPLDMTAHLDAVATAASGATVSFAGVVRDHDHGRSVASIEYLAHPTAQEVLGRVALAIAQEHPVDAVAVTHRVGTLAIGDCALAVAVSAAHRHEAFAAASALVEEVKRQVPVWKRQVFADGTQEWVACP